MSFGSSVNDLFELELAGSEDILTQLLKLSEDTLIVPEQNVSDVLVVTKLVSIASENVTVMLSVIDTELWLSAVVETEVTVGAVVSVVVEVSSEVVVEDELSVDADEPPSSLQEMTVKLKRDMRIMDKTLFIFSLH